MVCISQTHGQRESIIQDHHKGKGWQITNTIQPFHFQCGIDFKTSVSPFLLAYWKSNWAYTYTTVAHWVKKLRLGALSLHGPSFSLWQSSKWEIVIRNEAKVSMYQLIENMWMTFRMIKAAPHQRRPSLCSFSNYGTMSATTTWHRGRRRAPVCAVIVSLSLLWLTRKLVVNLVIEPDLPLRLLDVLH